MSEVKPTLIQATESEKLTPPNSWLSNFPTGKWIDAQSRDWFWVRVNSIRFASAYEYIVRFDSPVENATLIFPYVVKTSNSGIKKAFIGGVEYRVRSNENYGDMFVVSGQNFAFKIATKYKISKQTVPILSVEYKQAIFKNINLLDSNYVGLRYYSPNFITLNTVKADYYAIRKVSPVFITSVSLTSNYIRTRSTSSTFNNVNVFSAPVIANCRDTSWNRFGDIWASCETWIPST